MKKLLAIALSSTFAAMAAGTAGLKTGDTREIALPGGAKMVLIYCAPGEFMMGSENGQGNEKPVHKVRLTKGFWLGKYEVTLKQWKSVMGWKPYRYYRGDGFPVEKVSWNDCQKFIQKVNGQLGGGTRLPTEAEWEYACRAGTFGDCAGDIDAMAWHRGNSDLQTHPVGLKKENAWGFCDMHGNVLEWCNDWYGERYYSVSPTNDPQGPEVGSIEKENRTVLFAVRVLRGGSALLKGPLHDECRSARRHAAGCDTSVASFGFRLACDMAQGQADLQQDQTGSQKKGTSR